MGRGTNGIARLEVLDPAGKPRLVSELWRDAPAVIAFTRHFGCLLCHEQVKELKEALPQIEERGARLRVIGSGNPHHAGWFAERMRLAGAVFTDPARVAYRALGLKHGILRSVGPRTFGNALRAFNGGHRPATTQGDPWQQGGTLVVSQAGDLEYLHRSEVAGDHAPIADVLAALARRS